MMKVTLTLSDELAAELRLQPMDDEELSEIVQQALRRRNGVQVAEFEGLTDLLEVLAGLPTPEQILALRPSHLLQRRVSALLEKNRTETLSADEERWWEQYEYFERLVRVAKAKAATKLKAT